MIDAIENALKEVALWALALFLLGCLTSDYTQDEVDADVAKAKASFNQWRGAK